MTECSAILLHSMIPRNPACVLTDCSYDVGPLQEEFVGSHTDGELFMSIGGDIGDYNTDLMSSLLTKLVCAGAYPQCDSFLHMGSTDEAYELMLRLQATDAVSARACGDVAPHAVLNVVLHTGGHVATAA